jgi:hypothetical protein
MAGAISGAHLGLGAVPPHLADRLNDQGTWGLDELVEPASRAHWIATGAEELRGADKDKGEDCGPPPSDVVSTGRCC